MKTKQENKCEHILKNKVQGTDSIHLFNTHLSIEHLLGGGCRPGAGDPNPHRTFTLEEKPPQVHGAEISVQYRRGRQGGQCEEATFDVSGDKPADIRGKGVTGRRKCSLKVRGEGLLRVVGRVPWRELWSGASP